MLIRISGGVDGIKKYLEDGQKQDRDFSRNQLDERVILAGDLDLTDTITRDMESTGDKYLHITLAFKEDHIDNRQLQAVVNDFRQFMFASYNSDEFNFYAEAHLPKLKSYENKKNGELIERKPHIHIVIPKRNLLSGQAMDPFGLFDKSKKYIDAFQEYTNQKYGFASPKVNKRISFNQNSEVISRYKGDYFNGQSKELKEKLLKTILNSDIHQYEQFEHELRKFGSVRTRNSGTDREYQNVKIDGSSKGINLKDHVFTREFIELPLKEKLAFVNQAIQRSNTTEYEAAGRPKEPPQSLVGILQEWQTHRAREAKYLNSGNKKQYLEYMNADPNGRSQILENLQAKFYKKHLKENQTYEQENSTRHPTDGHHRKHGLIANTKGKKTQSLNSVRSLSSIGVVSFSKGSEVLLQDHAPHHLEHQGTQRVDTLRRDDDGSRELNPSKRAADNVVSQLHLKLKEGQIEQTAHQQDEFKTIKSNLDATRLLAELSQSHGLLVDKYQVTPSSDGSDRIRCGSRHLNVSDFLTKELNLPWQEAADLLKTVYAHQLNDVAKQPLKHPPRKQLWDEFKQKDDLDRVYRRETQWSQQKIHERERFDALKNAFNFKRSNAQSIRRSNPAEARVLLSLARMEKVQSELVLRHQIKLERAEIKAAQRKPIGDRYQEYLQKRAQAGDELALNELRRRTIRMQGQEQANSQAKIKSTEPIDGQKHVLFLQGRPITYQVATNGDVMYRRNGQDLLLDTQSSVNLIKQDDDALEMGLRLAVQKFGFKLTLSGDQKFQENIVRIAADAGMKLEFKDPQLQAMLLDRQKQLATDREQQAQWRQMAKDFAKDTVPPLAEPRQAEEPTKPTKLDQGLDEPSADLS